MVEKAKTKPSCFSIRLLLYVGLHLLAAPLFLGAGLQTGLGFRV